MTDDNSIFGEVISSYSRAQALEDGALVDVTETAREAGFKWPVALTRAAWSRYVEVPEGVRGQDEAGRLWDVLYMCKTAIRCARQSGTELLFQLLVRNDNRAPKKVTLKLMTGPGDDAEPVMTIMLTEED